MKHKRKTNMETCRECGHRQRHGIERCGRCGLVMPHKSYYKEGRYVGDEADSGSGGCLLLLVAIALVLVLLFGVLVLRHW